MIVLDDRIGSRDLIHQLPRGTARIERLQYGDAAWVGNGPGELPVTVGVEIKTLGDALNCLVDGRFVGHQLPGLIRSYQVVYLIIEGAYRPEEQSGVLEAPRGRGWEEVGSGKRRWMWRDFEAWLTSIESQTGVRLRKTSSRRVTALTVLGLYRWWTDKKFDEHRSMMVFDNSGQTGQTVELTKPRLVARVAAQLPGIGWMRAKAAGEKWGTVYDMVNAPVSEWGEVDGVGKGTAAKVVDAIRGVR